MPRIIYAAVIGAIALLAYAVHEMDREAMKRQKRRNGEPDQVHLHIVEVRRV